MNIIDIITQSIKEQSFLWFLIAALLGGLISAFFKFMFEVYFQSKLKARWEDQKTLNEIKFPFLRACKSLEKRIELVLKNNNANWVDDKNDDYFYLSTLYQFGVFFGWIRVLEDKAHLEFSNNKKTKVFYRLFSNVLESFTGHIHFSKLVDVPFEEKCKGTFQRLVIRAMGELMVSFDPKDSTAQTYRMLEFTEFVRRMNESDDFKKWFGYLGNFIRNLEQSPKDLRWDRLLIIASFLSIMSKYLDPGNFHSTSQITVYFDVVQNPEIVESLKISYQKLGMEKQLQNSRRFSLA